MYVDVEHSLQINGMAFDVCQRLPWQQGIVFGGITLIGTVDYIMSSLTATCARKLLEFEWVVLPPMAV